MAPAALAGDPNQYDGQIQAAAQQNGIPPALVKAVIAQESGFNPNARSGAGAVGLMQLMPGTASDLGLDPSQRTDPTANIDAGAKYLGQLYNKYNGNIADTLAAYNAGPGNVNKYGGVPPFAETQNYVKKVEGYYQQYGGNLDAPVVPGSGNSGSPSGQNSGGSGQTPSPTDTTGPGLAFTQFFQQLFAQLNTISQHLAGTLNADGQLLAGILAVILVSWTGIHAALKQDELSRVMAHFVEVLLICGAAFAAVQPALYESMIHQPIDNTFCQVASQVSGSGGADCRTLNASMTQLTAGSVTAILNIWNSLVNEAAALKPIQGDNWLDKFVSGVKTVVHLPQYLTLLTIMLFDGLAKLVAVCCLIWTMALCFITYTTSIILADIAFALGPVIIPWMILKPTREMVLGWVRFVIGAEMFRVVCLLLMGLGKPLIDKILSYGCLAGGAKSGCSQTTQLSSTTDPAVFMQLVLDIDVPLIIVAYLLMHFMKHAGSWATGLVSGTATAQLRTNRYF